MNVTLRSQCAGAVLLGLLLFPAGRSAADVIVEGTHGVDHEIYILGMDQFPDLEFAMYPVRVGSGTSTWQVVKQGEEVRWYKLLRPKLYAWKAAEGPPASESFFESDSVLRSDVQFRRTSQLDDDNPVVAITSNFRVTGVEGKLIQLMLESRTEYDKSGQVLSKTSGPIPVTTAETGVQGIKTAAGFSLLALLSIFLLVWLKKRGAGRAGSTSQ